MADNEIKRRLAGRAAEYMMFKDDEEDTEVPSEISSSNSVNDFSDLEESKKLNPKWYSKWQIRCHFGDWNKNAFRFIPNSFNE
mgnify:CR=1 FL=1